MVQIILSNTSTKLSGSPIRPTPVMIQHNTIPLKRVIASPREHDIWSNTIFITGGVFHNNPPMIRPTTKKLTYVTNHQTRYDKPYDAFSSISTSIFSNPCCMNIIASGILNNQSTYKTLVFYSVIFPFYSHL